MKRNLAVVLGFSFVSSWAIAQTPPNSPTSMPSATPTGAPPAPMTIHPASTMSPVNIAEQNKQAGEAFLSNNKNQPGVKTLPDGLQYKVITEGDGPKPTKNDIVTVDYEGKHLNGQVFDSSYQRGQPAMFPVSGVVAGWQEALQMMNTGATWELYIPANLAYGERGAPGAIAPNETLIFKVHLINVQK